jgi:hypothetical protein
MPDSTSNAAGLTRRRFHARGRWRSAGIGRRCSNDAEASHGFALELVQETLPRLARIGVLWDPATGFTQFRAIEAVAAIMRIELDVVELY